MMNVDSGRYLLSSNKFDVEPCRKYPKIPRNAVVSIHVYSIVQPII